MTIHYLSFADDTGWLGAIHVQADTFIEAVTKTHLLGINPGGEVMGTEIPEEALKTPEGQRILQVLDQFLTREAMEKLFGKLIKIEE